MLFPSFSKEGVLLTKQTFPKAAAVIDIGSNDINMIISETKGGKLNILDRLHKTLPIGHDVFHHTIIRFETLNELCEILNGYLAVLKEYGITACRAIATSALREAKNQAFVLDQISVKTGLSIHVCDDSQEKSMIYYESMRALQQSEANPFRKNKTLVCHLGTGSIGISVFDKDTIRFSQTIPVGSLKIHELLNASRLTSADFYNAAEEYLDVVFGNITMPYPEEAIENLVMTGTESALVASLCNVSTRDGIFHIKGNSLNKLFEKVKKSGMEEIAHHCSISEDHAELLYSSLAIFCRFLDLTNADEIMIPPAELTDAYLHRMLIKNWSAEYQDFLCRNTKACSETFADRHGCNPGHYLYVESLSGKLFAKMQQPHGLSERSRILLQCAAVLHDSGYYLSSRQNSSEDIVKHMDICGLTDQEMIFISLIGNYEETVDNGFDSPQLSGFTNKQKLLCSKLSAILLLAESTDASKKQKIRNLSVRIRGDRLIIAGECSDRLHLEHWAFQRASVYFKDVFGIQPELRVKSTLI